MSSSNAEKSDKKTKVNNAGNMLKLEIKLTRRMRKMIQVVNMRLSRSCVCFLRDFVCDKLGNIIT